MHFEKMHLFILLFEKALNRFIQNNYNNKETKRRKKEMFVGNQKKELKEGITFHSIETNKFKTNLFALFLAIPLEREAVTTRALLPAVLRRGCSKYPTQEKINKTLEEMYGATFDCGIDKNGDNQIIKFYVEGINEKYLPEQEPVGEKCLDMLLQVVLNPLLEQGKFKEEYVACEKNNLKNIIASKIDNKRKYAYDRCIEEMYLNDPYGIFKYGYLEEVDHITQDNLIASYRELLDRAKIDIFVSGDHIQNLEEVAKNHPLIQELKPRKPDFCVNEVLSKEKVEFKLEPKKVVQEIMQVNQGNLILGLDVGVEKEEEKEVANLYNAILGGGANSKLFQNVREKASLAYTAGSNYTKQKAAIFVRCGIEIENYEKAVAIIMQQLQDMQAGIFNQEDVESAKELIKATIKGIPEEQDTELTYAYGQEMAGKETTLDEYRRRVEEVTKEQIVDLAKRVRINTVYFLRNAKEGEIYENN